MCECSGFCSALKCIARRGFVRPVALHCNAVSSDGIVPPPPQPTGDARAPERVVLSRTIRTLDEARPVVEALAIRGGLLVAVGSRHEVLRLCGPRTEIVDLGDRVVLPGFIDPHVHAAFALVQDWLDVGPFTTGTIAEASEKISAAASSAPDGDWIKAKMIDFSLMPGDPYDRHVLDELCPSNPVLVLEANGHVMYVNSLAMKLAGLDRNTPDPPTARYGRDDNGELTGRLEEPPAFLPVMAAMGMPGPMQMVQNVRDFLQEAAEKGCTTLHDCGIGALSGRSDLDLLDNALATDPPVRYAGMLVSTHMKEWEELGLRPGRRSEHFHLTGIKAWSDGSVAAGTGYFREPYLGSKSRGALNYTQEEMESAIRAAHIAGWQVGVHSNGDAAMDTTLAAFEKILAEFPREDHRHRIEHASFCHPEHLGSMRRLGVSPSFLVNHVHYWGKAYQERLVGLERTDLLDPCASALKAGLRISFHSDYCVTPIDPLLSIQTAVVRNMKEGGDILNAAERIDVLEAIRAVTLDAAWQCKLNHICGSLQVGKAADLVVLEEDPLKVEPTSIANISIHSTWLDGKLRAGSLSIAQNHVVSTSSL